MGTLESELKRIFPKKGKDVATVLSIPDLYASFCAKMKDREVVDPIGNKIVFRVEYWNESEGKWVQANAGSTIKALDDGTFDEGKHRCDSARAKGVLRIPELLTAPDSIHKNIHARVKGEYVYVKGVGTTGIKVVFTTHNRTGELVPVTSFYTTEKYVKTCAKQPALYGKK
jgi:hypothetical protein